MSGNPLTAFFVILKLPATVLVTTGMRRKYEKCANKPVSIIRMLNAAVVPVIGYRQTFGIRISLTAQILNVGRFLIRFRAMFLVFHQLFSWENKSLSYVNYYKRNSADWIKYMSSFSSGEAAEKLQRIDQFMKEDPHDDGKESDHVLVIVFQLSPSHGAL